MQIPLAHPFSRVLLALAVLATGRVSSLATDSFLQDLASGQKQDLPGWMEGPPMATPALHATVSFPIHPPAADDDLLLTIFFREKAGSFLRVYWDDGYNKEMLCENLAEGIGMLNRRTLLIKRSVMVASGMLTFQSSEPVLGVDRLFWQWGKQQPVFLDEPWMSGGYLQRGGNWLSDDEIDGFLPTPRSDSWSGEVVTAVIAQKAERIEKGAEYSAELTEMPKLARLKVRVSGLSPTANLQLWLNGKAAGQLQFSVPDLTDPGLQISKKGELNFTGWREGTLLVDVSLLQIGDNTFQFQAEPSKAALAIKDFDLQLQYP